MILILFFRIRQLFMIYSPSRSKRPGGWMIAFLSNCDQLIKAYRFLNLLRQPTKQLNTRLKIELLSVWHLFFIVFFLRLKVLSNF